MKPLQCLCSFSAGVALTCALAWDISPNYVDQDGILREPFALIPIGYLATTSTLICGGALWFRRR